VGSALVGLVADVGRACPAIVLLVVASPAAHGALEAQVLVVADGIGAISLRGDHRTAVHALDYLMVFRTMHAEKGCNKWAYNVHVRLGMRTLTILAALAIVSACAASNPPPPPAANPAQSAERNAALPDRDPALAHRLVEEGAVLLDVRTAEEYQARHIDGAVNIPVDDLSTRMEDIAKLTGNDAHKAIVVYCGSGKRAARAKELLVSKGYSRVTNLGGIDAWHSR